MSVVDGFRPWWVCVVVVAVVLAVILANASRVSAADVMLRWTVPPEPDVAGFRVYSGAESRVYGVPIDVGARADATLDGVVYYYYPNVPLASPTYVAVTAYNTAQLESDYSNEKLFDLSSVSPPAVDAGPDVAGTVGQVLALGSSPQTGISYFWQQTAGPEGMLSDPTSSSTQFTAATAGTYELTLTAYDSQGIAAQDGVTVVLVDAPTNTPTSTANSTPVDTPVPTATPEPAATFTATTTATLAPTATKTPTSTPSPTATDIITPSPTATATATPLPNPHRRWPPKLGVDSFLSAWRK